MSTIRAGVWWVELPNGHRLVARLLRRDASRMHELGVGSMVKVSVSPADLSKGIVVAEAASRQ